jgi:hypothetical protein
MGSAVAALMWDAVEPESVALDGVELEGVELIGVPVLRLEPVTPSSSRRHAAAVTPDASTGYRHWLAPSASDSRESGFVLVPSRPGEFHPEPLTGRVEDWRAGRQKEVFDRTTFPVPATSNAACGFPALRSPVCFTSRVIGPIPPGQLSAPVVERDSYCKASPPRTTTAYSTAPSRSLFVSVPASYGAGPSSLPSL